MSMIWTIVAVVAAGVAGTLANSVVVALLTPNAFLPLALSPGRSTVAIAVAVLLPLIFRFMSGPGAAIVAVLALTIIPTVLAKTVFGIQAPWVFGLGVNAVYALVAWAAYLAVAGATSRRDSGRA